MVLFKKAIGRDLLRDLLVGLGNQIFFLVSGSKKHNNSHDYED